MLPRYGGRRAASRRPARHPVLSHEPREGVFFFNDTATTEIYTLSLHDALPISGASRISRSACSAGIGDRLDVGRDPVQARHPRSEEHTSELQSRQYLV